MVINIFCISYSNGFELIKTLCLSKPRLSHKSTCIIFFKSKWLLNEVSKLFKFRLLETFFMIDLTMTKNDHTYLEKETKQIYSNELFLSSKYFEISKFFIISFWKVWFEPIFLFDFSLNVRGNFKLSIREVFQSPKCKRLQTLFTTKSLWLGKG